MSRDDDPRESRRFALAAVVIVVAAVVTVLPSLDGEFLNWDDDRFVAENPHVAGLSGENLAWAFGGIRFESYQPLHMVSYMVDGSFWPRNATLYRAHSLALYLAALVLLLALLRRLGFETVGAALGTLLFGLAPFHAESVAWIAGRKDVLALLLTLVAWHLYLSSAATRLRRVLLGTGALLAFLCALLAKSAAMVAPVMMLAADVGLRGVPWRRALIRAAPCLLLAVVAGVAVVLLWSGSELIRPEIPAGALGRIGLIGWSLSHYLRTMLWPFGLSPLYAEPDSGALLAGGLAAVGAVLIAGAALALGVRRSWNVRGPVVAAIWFLAGIGPFLNLAPLYYLVNDRYLLFPSLGLALAVALLANRVLQLGRADRRVIGGAGLLLVAAAWGMARVEECRAWHDSRSLWTHAVEREPDAFFARLKLAETLREAGDPDEAAEQYREARRIRPGSRLAITGLFWAELLSDPPARELNDRQVNGHVLRFAASLDDRRALARLAARLRAQGFERAAAVVAERLAPRPRSAQSPRKNE